MQLQDMYQEIILDHYRNPHHKGLREPFDAQVYHVNPTCGDEVTLRVALKPGVPTTAGVEKKVTEAIEHQIGKIARPRKVHVVPDMPKTRSGKIMRRVLAAISNQMDTGDVTTLANAEVADDDRYCRTVGEPCKPIGQGQSATVDVHLAKGDVTLDKCWLNVLRAEFVARELGVILSRI